MGLWNFQEVTVRGSTVRVELNGFTILDTDLAKAKPAAYLGNLTGQRWQNRASGFFGLVGEGTGLAVRGLAMKKLPTFAK